MTTAACVRFAVVGLGLMGQRHCRILKSVPGAALTAVYDRTTDLAEQVAREYGLNHCSSFEEILDSKDIDAVVICLPSSLHADFGVPAAHAGKHVVVEKPLDADSRSGRRLISACEEAKVQCAVISQYRFSDGLWSVKKAYDAGYLGKLMLVRASIKWFRHDEYYTQSEWRGKVSGERGGVLMNQAVHAIDALQWFLGQPAELNGFTDSSRPDVMEMEDTAAVVMRFTNGTIGTLEASTCAAPGFDDVYEFQGPTASVIVRKGRITHWYHAESLPEPAAADFPEGPALDTKFQLFFRQYLNIVGAIRGTGPLEVTSAQALAVVETIESIYARVKLPVKDS